MGKWEMVKVKDCFSTVTRGKTPCYVPKSSIMVINQACIYWDSIKMDNAKYQDDNKANKMIFVQRNDLLINSTGTGTLGRCNVFDLENTTSYVIDTHVTLLRPNKSVNPSFIRYYFMMEETQRELYKKCVNGSTNQIELSKNQLLELYIPMPLPEVQCQIADVLDRASALVEKRKAQLEKLDLLIKSQFIEMFGDPVINPKGWQTRELSQECAIITGNTPSRSDSTNYGEFIEWIKSDNINTPNMYLTKATEKLSKQGFKKGRSVQSGCILMTCIAGSIGCIGNVAVTDREVTFNQQINAIIPNNNNVFFLYYLFLLSKRYIQSTVSMSLKGILSKGKLLELKFIFPPISLQNQFADFVRQVETQKSLLKHSLAKLELNYKSLMQKCFRGEIF